MYNSSVSNTIKDYLCLFGILILLLAFVGDAFASPSIAGCAVFTDDNVWNTPVDTLPVSHSIPKTTF